MFHHVKPKISAIWTKEVASKITIFSSPIFAISASPIMNGTIRKTSVIFLVLMQLVLEEKVNVLQTGTCSALHSVSSVDKKKTSLKTMR